MKKLFFIMFLAAFCFSSVQARYITVNNNPGSLAMFSKLQEAIDFASKGDTVFVMNSSIVTNSTIGNSNYGNLVINKPLLLIGEGYRQSNGSVFSIPTIGDILILDTIKIKGIIFRNFRSDRYSEISDCLILGDFYLQAGITYKCRIYGQVQVGTVTQKVVVSNCIIGSNVSYSIVSSEYSIIKNNIIFGDVYQCDNVIFHNNIFLRSLGGSVASLFGNTYLINNVTQYPLSNNYANNSELFQNTKDNTYDYNPSLFSTSFGSRFLLTSTNSTQLTGTDGTEVGVYGGMYPWNKLVIDSGNIGLPIVSKFELIETRVEKDAAIKVNFKAIRGKK